MPSPLYTNATVDAAEKKRRFGVTIEPPAQMPYTAPVDEGDPLGEAKASLGRAQDLADETDSEGLAGLEGRAAALTPPVDHRGRIRQITEPLAKMGGAAVLASLPGMTVPPVGTALATGGTLAEIPDLIRRTVAPEADESMPGALEYGGTALGAIPALGALRGGMRAATGAAAAGSDVLRGDEAVLDALKRATLRGKWSQAAVSDAGGVQQATNPNQVLGIARDIAGETGGSLESILKGARKYPEAQRTAIMKLATSGAVYPAEQLANEAAAEAELAKQTPYQRWLADNAGTDRTTGSFDGRYGLDSYSPDKIAAERLASLEGLKRATSQAPGRYRP
jgi:hypothetical protein